MVNIVPSRVFSYDAYCLRSRRAFRHFPISIACGYSLLCIHFSVFFYNASLLIHWLTHSLLRDIPPRLQDARDISLS